MKTYETSTTVQAPGHVHIAGVPFAAGTEVEVVIREKVTADANASKADAQAERRRTADLLAALDMARNSRPVGRLRREELYDREILC